MTASALNLGLNSSAAFSSSDSSSCRNSPRCIILLQFHLTPAAPLLLKASRRVSSSPGESNNLADDARSWSPVRGGEVIGDYYDEDEDEDEDQEDRSLDLLIRFIQNIFRKISRKARKAVRSVLPVTISSKLVGFSVNGVIILTFLWVLKAFLEVICTLGSVVFVSILLIQGLLTAVSYLRDSQNQRADDEQRVWTGTRHAI